MDPLSLLALAISLKIPTDSPGNMSLDISPQFGIEAPIRQFIGTGAITLPGVTLIDPNSYSQSDTPGLAPVKSTSQEIMSHELHHWGQQRALGPWFWPSYAASGGTAFEPYNIMDPSQPQNWNNAWAPSQSMEDNYPVFRVNFNNGTPNFSLFPGYGQLLDLFRK